MTTWLHIATTGICLLANTVLFAAAIFLLDLLVEASDFPRG